MKILIWILAILSANLLLGILVLCFIDRRDALLNWLDKAPLPSWRLIALELWPVILIMFYRDRKKKNDN